MFVKIINQQLDLEVKTEYFFHPTRKWRFDYAIPSIMCAVEVEGGVWKYGRHNRASGYIKDLEKYNEATALGWRIIRVLPDDLLSENTIHLIKKIKEINND